MDWESESRVRRLFRQQELNIGRFFDIALSEYLGDLDIGRLETLFQQGRILEALDDIQNIAIATATANQSAMIAAANATTVYIQSGSVATVGFDVANTNTINAMRRNKLEFVQDFTQKQIRATRSALQAGVAEGIAPREMARRFRSSIGLTEYQEKTVRNYRRYLQRIGGDDVPRRAQYEALGRKLRDRRSDSVIRRAIKTQKPLTTDEIDRMVEGYRRKAIKLRSETIARTEALSSTHEGRNLAMGQAIESGAIKAQDIIRQWNTGQDGKQRPAHNELHRVKIGYGEVYQNSIGAIAHPGDRSADASNVINCRCIETFRLK